MADNPSEEEPEVEIVCAHCGYRMPRSADRLRRDAAILCPNCGAVIVPPGKTEEPPAR